MSLRNALVDVPIFVVTPSGASVVGARETFPDVRAKIQRIAELATDTTQTPRCWRLLTIELAGRGLGRLATLEALHDWRRRCIEFAPEREQILQSPDHVLVRRRGDCTAHAAVGAALALLVGARVAFPTWGGTPEDPEHLSLAVSLETGGPAPAAWYPWGARPPLAAHGWIWTDSSVAPDEDYGAPFGLPPGVV